MFWVGPYVSEEAKKDSRLVSIRWKSEVENLILNFCLSPSW